MIFILILILIVNFDIFVLLVLNLILIVFSVRLSCGFGVKVTFVVGLFGIGLKLKRSFDASCYVILNYHPCCISMRSKISL